MPVKGIKVIIKEKLEAHKSIISKNLYNDIIKYTDEKELFKGRKRATLNDFDKL